MDLEKAAIFQHAAKEVVQANLDCYSVKFIYCWLQAIELWLLTAAISEVVILRKKLTNYKLCCQESPFWLSKTTHKMLFIKPIIAAANFFSTILITKPSCAN